MDKYMCRAKRIDNSKWVYGYYVVKEDSLFKCKHHFILVQEYDDNLLQSFVSWYQVKPDTVCRCTGVKDNNGNMIFEHDIIGHSLYSIGAKSEVVWRGSCFCAGRYTLDTFHSKRVHGNIFDNTELMEEQHV